MGHSVVEFCRFHAVLDQRHSSLPLLNPQLFTMLINANCIHLLLLICQCDGSSC